MKNITRLNMVKVARSEVDKIVMSQLKFILRICSPLRVILFGSALTESFYPDSDLDFAIVFQEKESARIASKKLYSTIGRAWPSDYLCIDEESFNLKANTGGVYMVAATEGVKIFEAGS